MLDFTIRRGPKPASIAKISEARSLAVVSAIVDKLWCTTVIFFFFYFFLPEMTVASGSIDSGGKSSSFACIWT